FTIQNTGTANLNLTGTGPTYIVVSGTHAGDFSVTANPTASIAASGNTTFTIIFNPSAVGLRTATLTIANDDSDENPYNFDIKGTGFTTLQEINVQGNTIDIPDNDTTPISGDDTDFGNVDVAAGTQVNTFTIQNTGTVNNLNLTGTGPTYIAISGVHAGDFTVTANPTTPITSSGSTTFNITFNPSAIGLRTATLTIANNDTDENPYNFDIQGTGTDACGGYITVFPYTEDFETGTGLWAQDAGDNFDWTRQTGTTPTGTTGPSAPASGSYYMFTEADGNNSNTANFISPCFDLTGTTNPRLTLFYHMYGADTGTINIDLSSDSGVTYPTNIWTYTGQVKVSTNSSWNPISIDLSAYIGQTIKLRIQGIVGAGNNSDMAIDNISLTDKLNPTIGPGGVTANLAVWLKGTEGLSYTDGQNVSSWSDQGLGSDLRVHTIGQEPTYRDNATKNVNFNPVVEFDNSYATYTEDTDYSHDDSNSEFLIGDYGLYTQDMFIVLIPDDTPINNSFGFFDIFCGDENIEKDENDATGFGVGQYTARFSNEILCYAVGTTGSGNGYGIAEIGTGNSYTNVGILNARNNIGTTQQELYYNANDVETNQNDIPDFSNVNDSRFWIGRSEGWEASLNGRVAEVITYSARKGDADLTQDRNKIQSYLGIKYGITLGVNGTSQDYVNSDGTIIWDQSANATYNYDIAGIGRDDASGLNQKQSSSANNATDGTGLIEGILTIGLSDIYDTNNINKSTNPTTFNNKEFLTWGNNGADISLAASVVNVDMSAGIAGLTTPVTFTAMQRVWKVVENGGDIPSVSIRIPQNAVRNITPPGSFLMFISNTPVFDPTADYRVMTANGADLETDYDFDGTKYITFGYAPQVIVERSIYFDGAVDYVDMEDALDLSTTNFTVSAWIKRDTGTINASIVSKRDATYTEGYDLRINNAGNFEVAWNGGAVLLTSSVVIPENEWHQVS
ncbi:MAG: choice-of-anchor D domain-containing protein, partial [Gammaproteobacteria bacterium]|nr:choice-of-anchor D domain-containing protein [Gammaproteobacteria bacterium]